MELVKFRALLRKNFLLKVRARRQTAMEFLFPLMFIAILSMLGGHPKIFPAEDNKPIRGIPELQSFCAVRRGGCADFSFAPSASSWAVAVAAHVQATHNGAQTYGYANGKDLADAINDGTAWGGVVLEGDGSDDTLEYTIRTPVSFIGGSDPVGGGYMTLQRAVHSAFASILSNRTFVLDVASQEFPSREHTIPATSSNVWPFYFIFVFTYLAVQFTISLVTEKSKRLRQALKMTGVSDSVYWAHWLVTYAGITFLTVVVFMIGLYATGLVKRASPVPLLIIFLIYSASQLGLAMICSSMFDSPRVAAGALNLLLLSSIAVFAVAEQLLLKKTGLMVLKFFACLIVAVPFGHLITELSRFEQEGQAFGMGDVMSDRGEFTSSTAFWFLLLDSVLYILLGLYLDQVIPGEWGVAEEKLFFLRPTYWRGESGTDPPLLAGINRGNEDGYGSLSHAPLVTMRNLTKVFPPSKGRTESLTAVDDVDMEIHKGEISCLLGHNGAGKSTTIAMLTGLIAPTRGDAIICGHSVVTHLAFARQCIGVCPQSNVLYDTLTATEHLELFGILKGVHRDQLSGEVQAQLDDMQLSDTASMFAKDFSGGMKRKLCVAMAFMGSPDVVFLDEPSSGMDPHSRRSMWRVLQEQKESTAVVLTTHYMEEADALGDTITILSHGRIAAAGSALHLKTNFGVGYRLHVELEGGANLTASAGALLDLVRGVIPEAKLESESHQELTMVLPLAGADLFPLLLKSLDEERANGDTIDITDYAISMSTLEEAFLKIAEG